MEKSDIISGLKSALNRGYPLDFAKKSFINAGYSSQDVDDSAAVLINGGEITASTNKPSMSTPSNVNTSDDLSRPSQPVSSSITQHPVVSQTPIQPAYKPLPKMPVSNYNRSSDDYGAPNVHGFGLVIVLSIVFLIVLGVLGMLIFKRSLVENLLRSWGLI